MKIDVEKRSFEKSFEKIDFIEIIFPFLFYFKDYSVLSIDDGMIIGRQGNIS